MSGGCKDLIRPTPIIYILGFSIVNEADVFLVYLCIFYDPMGVDNLSSGSSAFSKARLYIWKFSVHILAEAQFEGCWVQFSVHILAEAQFAGCWVQFSVHILAEAQFAGCKCSLTSRSHECSCTALCTFSGTALLWDWNENTYLFQSCGHYWVF